MRMEQAEDGPDMELGQLGSGPVVEIDSAGGPSFNSWMRRIGAISCAIFGVLFTAFLICAPLLTLVHHEGPGPIKLVCSDEEVSPICKPWLNLTFPGSPGTLRQPTPGTQCEWLMKKDHQQDQPCCYKDFTASEWNEEVCDFAEKNLALKQRCRVRSPPVVYMLEKTCKLSIRNPSEQDVGCYEGSMPWNAPDKPHFRQCVSYNEICPSYTIKPSCKVKLWFIEFGVCAIILAIFLTIAAIVFRKFGNNYTQPSEQA